MCDRVMIGLGGFTLQKPFMHYMFWEWGFLVWNGCGSL